MDVCLDVRIGVRTHGGTSGLVVGDPSVGHVARGLVRRNGERAA
jgi:hypothetical protein